MLQDGRLHHRRRRQVAPRPRRRADRRLERRHQARPARDRLRLLLPHPRHRRPRAVRVRREPPRRRPRPRRPDPASATSSKIGDEPTGKREPRAAQDEARRHGHDKTIVNGISRIGYMTGGKAARWVDEDMADDITGKAVEFIEQNKDKPFFLFFATHDIHVPRVPHPRFAGKSELGPRGDVIARARLVRRRDPRHARPAEARRQHARHLHQRQRPRPRRRLRRRRRGKARRPQARRPVPRRQVQRLRRRHARPVHRPLAGAKVKPGRVGRAGLPDRSAPQPRRAHRRQTLPDGAGPDSVDVLPALLGESPKGRETLVEHAGRLAIRRGSGSLSNPRTKAAPASYMTSPPTPRDEGPRRRTSGNAKEPRRRWTRARNPRRGRLECNPLSCAAANYTRRCGKANGRSCGGSRRLHGCPHSGHVPGCGEIVAPTPNIRAARRNNPARCATKRTRRRSGKQFRQPMGRTRPCADMTRSEESGSPWRTDAPRRSQCRSAVNLGWVGSTRSCGECSGAGPLHANVNATRP